jgi:hypothetical protein
VSQDGLVGMKCRTKWGRAATRYAKCAAYFRAEIIIAAIVSWLRTDPQDTP